ncbi:NAD(P)/FAD-dependent oxidoreductase [Selenomonas sp. TAMA-11512]|uniref:protoporphyrinogen/coproporphyrinogen oxidase n=1 Tax=Selenomonas sp. TAMA-11512 TaxID=3095337 RepID=UPI003091AD60|nr:NAD(P)/FAD-dependent oxidoreductase [Selenomonas sp. TAMA-11512]
MEKQIVILGAGCAGLAAAHELFAHGVTASIYDKKDMWGGLCQSFVIDGYTFDTFAHVNFATDPYVHALLEEKTPYLVHAPEAMNYSRGNWVRNPVQNNLIGLPVEERIRVIKSFLSKGGQEEHMPKDYGAWLRLQYGTYFTENYPARYTRKYWTVEPEALETEWVKGRMYTPTIDEVLQGAMSEDTPNVHYTKVIHYPRYGGYQAFLAPLAEEADLRLGKALVSLDPKKRCMCFSDGTEANYDALISTIPLPFLIESLMIDVPQVVRRAADRLDATGGAIVSIALSCPSRAPALWFYIYDEDIYPARVYAPEIKSPNNVPKGMSAFQAEVYFSRYRPLPCRGEELGYRVVSQLEQMGVLKKSEIVFVDVREEAYANIMFTPTIYEAREVVRSYLSSVGIYTAGRFGTWEYLWTGGSILSGRDVARSILKGMETNDL